MESKQKPTSEIQEVREEKEMLKKIVDTVFSTDIANERRHQPVVEARMVFSKILTDRGHTITSIGRYLNKNHATIIYYNRNIADLLEMYPYLFSKYMECKSSFLENREPVVFFKERKLQGIIHGLMNKVDEVTQERDDLRNILKKYKRFERIIELLHDRNAMLYEDEVYKKINAMLNNNEV